MQAYFLDATASDKNKNEAFLWIQFAWNKHDFNITKQINLVWKDKYRHHGSPLPILYAFRIVTNSPRTSTGNVMQDLLDKYITVSWRQFQYVIQESKISFGKM